MYFVHKKEVERRQTIRKYVKQNMIVDGKKINYVFVVASLLNDTQSMNELKAENSKYGDLLISVHEDNYRLVPITILDAYYWVREYCKTVTFVARIDGDVWIHLGNLLHYLQEIPRAKMVVGLPCEIKHYGETFYYKGIPNIPFDYPRPIHFVGGGAYVLSRDVIPYINIGTMYMNVLLPISEDIIVSEILRRVGIGIYPPSPKYSIYIDYQPGMTIPSNIVFLHYLKDMSLFNSIYSMYSSSYLIPYYKY